MELYIARHGETEANATRRFQGSGMDTPLTSKGIIQAKTLRQSLKNINFDAIYASPLKRAMDTACIVFDDKTLFDQRGFTDNRLVEIGVGDAEGIDWNEAAITFPAMEHLMTNPSAYIPPTNGETLPDMITRVDSFLQELAAKPYKRVFVLAHGYVLRVVYACTKDKTPAAIAQAPIYDNCALARYIYNGTNWEPI